MRDFKVRSVNFATGIILTVDGEDRWVEPDELERFCDEARVAIENARQRCPQCSVHVGEAHGSSCLLEGVTRKPGPSGLVDVFAREMAQWSGPVPGDLPGFRPYATRLVALIPACDREVPWRCRIFGHAIYFRTETHRWCYRCGRRRRDR